jgi:hypothetical protein
MGNNWNRVSYPSQNGIVDLPRGKSGKRGYASPEKIRQDAMNSSEGGRGYCEICNHGFSMTYIKHCVRNMRDIDVCVDCAKKNNLRNI